MKRKLLLSLAAAAVLPVMADYNGPGYYRVENYKTDRWVSIIDNRGSIDLVATAADLQAIKLQQDFSQICSDPGSVLYISEVDNEYNVEAQGTSIYQIIKHYMRLMEDGKADNGQKLYRAYGSYSGITRYLGDGNKLSGDLGGMTINASGDYTKWYILPITANGDDYFGAVADVTVGSNLYTTEYTSFPYSAVNSGVKAYYIKRVGNGMAEMVEISGTIPANTPVILQCVGKTASDNRLMPGGSANAVADNSLKGTFFNCDIPGHENRVAYDAKTMRVLGKCADGTLGFVTASGLDYIPANTAYLTVADGSPAEFRCVTTTEYDANTPKVPTELYLVGNFNDWKTPDTGSAVVLTKGSGNVYTATLSYGTSGLLEFKMFSAKSSDWKDSYGAETKGNVTLTAGTPYSWNMKADGDNFSVSNWGGGSGTVTVNWDAKTISIVTDKVATTDYPASLHLVGTMNGWDPANTNYSLTSSANNGVYTGTFNIDPIGDGLIFKVCVDNSLDNAYGGNLSFPLYSDKNLTTDMTLGGNDWVCNNWMGGKLTVTVDWNSKKLTMVSPDQPAYVSEDVIYYVGDANEWNINSSDLKLYSTDGEEYKGTFFIPAKEESNFRFYTQLGDWEQYSIGSSTFQEVNFEVPFVDGVYHGVFDWGKGNWQLKNWEGNNLTVTINLIDKSVIFEVGEAGVSSISGDSNSINYANGVIDYDGNITVFNTAGKVVAKGNGSLDINNLPGGVYIITAVGEKSLKVVK